MTNEESKRTAAATAARVRGRLDRMAGELSEAGFVVMSPEELAKMPRDEYGCIVAQIDPPRPAGVERHTFETQDAEARAIEAGADPVDVLAERHTFAGQCSHIWREVPGALFHECQRCGERE